jgi:hypothetical protein
VREFLSLNSVSFEDRNIAKEPAWRIDLLALTGEIIVPVLVVDDKRVIGLDEEGIAAALGLGSYRSQENRVGLAVPAEMTDLTEEPAGVAEAELTHFVHRLQREMDFNAAKGDGPYRDGQHDGMRFARDAILRILTGQYQREEMVIEGQGDFERNA